MRDGEGPRPVAKDEKGLNKREAGATGRCDEADWGAREACYRPVSARQVVLPFARDLIGLRG